MERIRINNQEFNLIPMGITTSDKKRSFTISSTLPYADIETAFSNVDRIEYLSDSGEVLATYVDGVALKSLSRDIENGTYTAEIGIDTVEKKLQSMSSQVDDLTNTIVIISML
jgi:hypothetical protein